VAQWNDRHVRLFAPNTGQLLREHLRDWHRLHDDDRRDSYAYIRDQCC
jgi:hypothetical protein